MTVFDNRTKHGKCYVSIFPDNTQIPWKRLSLKDFMSYKREYDLGVIPSAVIEDEIFKKCVLDGNFIINIDRLRAGMVTTVTTAIMLASGPTSPQQISNDLNVARNTTFNFIDDCAGLVCQAFPGYTVEGVKDLSYENFLEVLSIAERRLMAMGILQEPVEPVMPEDDMQTPERREAPKFKDLSEQPTRRQPSRPQKKTRDYIAPSDPTQQNREIKMSLPGADQVDANLWQHDALEGLEFIYPELVAKARAGEKITPETIRANRGKTEDQIKSKYATYKKDVLDGKIKIEPSKTLIAWNDGESGRSKVSKVKRKG